MARCCCATTATGAACRATSAARCASTASTARGPEGSPRTAIAVPWEGLLPAVRGLAADLGERYLPGSPVHGQPLPDVEAAMDARGLAESYEAVLDDALSRAASEGAPRSRTRRRRGRRRFVLARRRRLLQHHCVPHRPLPRPPPTTSPTRRSRCRASRNGRRRPQLRSRACWRRSPRPAPGSPCSSRQARASPAPCRPPEAGTAVSSPASSSSSISTPWSSPTAATPSPISRASATT